MVTTQVQNEGSDLAVYNVGHRLKRDLGVLESYDMTIEAAVAKLMWALAQTRDSRAVAALFYTPVAQDILSRPGTFSLPVLGSMAAGGGTPAAPG